MTNDPATSHTTHSGEHPGATSSQRRGPYEHDEPHGAPWAGQWIDDEIEKANGKSMRNAKSVTGFPVGEHGEDHFFAQVGLNYPYYNKSAPIVEAITVTNDLEGPVCDMDRVRVWGPDGALLWEGPLHNLEGVSYV